MSNTNKKTLVIGASIKPERYSNIATRRLVNNNIDTIALGLREGNIGAVKILTERPNDQNIHTVTLYIGAKHQPDFYDYIIQLNPQRVIFNPGTENPEFYELLQKKDIEVVIACTLVLLSTDNY